MVMYRKPLAALAAAAVAVTLAGCGGGTTSGNKNDASAPGTKGGTLNYLTFRPTEHLDPQRTYIGRDITNMDRLVYRGSGHVPDHDGRQGGHDSRPRPRDRHRHHEQGRQDLVVHAQGRRQVGGRQGHHV